MKPYPLRLTNAAGVEETYVNSEELRGAFDFGSSGDEQAHLVRPRRTKRCMQEVDS